MKFSPGAECGIHIGINQCPPAMVDRVLHLIEVIVSRQQCGSAPQVGFNNFVRTEHIQKLFARELPNEESLPTAWGDQTLVFQNRQRFSYGSTADTERLGQPLLDEWFIAFKFGVKDCMLDRLVRSLPKPARPSNGDQFESLIHIFHLSHCRTKTKRIGVGVQLEAALNCSLAMSGINCMHVYSRNRCFVDT